MRRALLRTILWTFVPALLLAPALQAQTLDQTLGGCGGVAPLRTINANPSTYKALLTTLQPGDRLLLAPGTYTQQLRIGNKNGQPGKCIVVEGPASGSPARSGVRRSTSWSPNRHVRNVSMMPKNGLNSRTHSCLASAPTPL